MGDIVNMQDVKNGKISDIEWAFVGKRKDGTTYPEKVWQNLELILKKHNIKLKFNEVSKQIETEPPRENTKRNTLLTDIYTLNVLEGLYLSRDETLNCINKIAENNSYNPFLDIIRENENDDYELINKLFNCIQIKDTENYNYYYTLFVKWCINLVKMAHNTLENQYRLAGVLVLQGEQGCRKTTFVEKLMPSKALCKCDKTLNPEKTDSIIENTKYILVEWGELDSTLKAEQAKLKQFITASSDEYRAPYARLPETYPRLTSYIGTVNKLDFLKDETGSRRFWIIPVEGFDFEILDSIDKCKFWGAVYSLWKSGRVKDYLEEDEFEKLNVINKDYNYQSDVSLLIEERFDWDTPEDSWEIHGLKEIASYLGYLGCSETKKIKVELEKKGLRYGAHRSLGGRVKKGFKLPPFEKTYLC